MINAIRLLLLAVIMMVCSTTLYAQSSRQRITREQLAEVQAKHIADELDMGEAKSKRFINTYCQFQKELWSLGPRYGRKRRPSTNEDTEQDIKKRFEHSQKILDLREKYYGIYSEFLTQKQIKRVYELERQMMNRLKSKGVRRRK